MSDQTLSSNTYLLFIKTLLSKRYLLWYNNLLIKRTLAPNKPIDLLPLSSCAVFIVTLWTLPTHIWSYAYAMRLQLYATWQKITGGCRQDCAIFWGHRMYSACLLYTTVIENEALFDLVSSNVLQARVIQCWQPPQNALWWLRWSPELIRRRQITLPPWPKFWKVQLRYTSYPKATCCCIACTVCLCLLWHDYHRTRYTCGFQRGDRFRKALLERD